MDTTDRMDIPEPPAPPHPGEPQPTADDPTAAGYYCGANRMPRQIAAAIEAGRNPWPWCMNRAGKGTPHRGIGRCRNHGGNLPNHRQNAMLRYAELHHAAMETFARAMVDPDVPWPSKIRAAENVEDRSGYPRRVEIDADAGADRVYHQIVEWQATRGDDDEVVLETDIDTTPEED